jgi:hypothetical protein
VRRDLDALEIALPEIPEDLVGENVEGLSYYGDESCSSTSAFK